MRGVVSLAAALAIPVSLADGSAFPLRNLILFITFMVILLTLVIQGLTLPYFIRRTKAFDLFPDEPEDEALKKLRAGLKAHTHAFLKAKFDGELKENAALQRMMKYWEEKMQSSNEAWMTGKMRKVYLEMLDSQRKYLAEINKDISVDEELIRAQLYQIDLDEEKMKMM